MLYQWWNIYYNNNIKNNNKDMDITQILMIVGMVLLNGGLLIGFFMKLSTKIAEQNIKIVEIYTELDRHDTLIKDNRNEILCKIEKIEKELDYKVEKIENKLDLIIENQNKLAVEVAKIHKQS